MGGCLRSCVRVCGCVCVPACLPACLHACMRACVCSTCHLAQLEGSGQEPQHAPVSQDGGPRPPAKEVRSGELVPHGRLQGQRGTGTSFKAP